MGWRSRDIIRTAALVIAMYLGLRLLWFAQTLVFTVFLGILFGLAVSSGVDRLQRWRIPRAIGAAAIVLGSVALLGGLGAWMAPTLRAQSRELRTRLPEAADKIQIWVEKHRGGVLGAFLDAGSATADATTQAASSAATAVTGVPDTARPAGAGTPPDSASQADATRDSARDATRDSARDSGRDSARDAARAEGGEAQDRSPGRISLRERLMSQAAGARRFFFGFVTSTIAAITGLVLVLVLAAYIAVDPDMYHRGLMHVVPFGGRRRAGEVLSAMATTLRKWLVTQLVAMVVIGAVTTATLLAMGIEAALPLGIIAGLLEFVPTIGPILSAVPAVAMGFIDSPQTALWVALAYLVIQQLENHLLIPYLMKSGVDLPPALTIVAQALMALVFGFLGLLVAVPMLAATMVAVKMLYVQDVVGDDVDVGDEDDDD